MKHKGWIVFGIVVIASIIAFAIYKVAGTKDTSITTGGGSGTKATPGLAEILASFKGLFGGSDSDETPLDTFGGNNPGPWAPGYTPPGPWV